jgi:hypothetical protein
MTFSAWPLGSEEYIIISNKNKNKRLLKKRKMLLQLISLAHAKSIAFALLAYKLCR